MSTAAVKNFPATSGSSAAKANPAAGEPGSRKNRTPLSVVRSVPRKRRAPFVVLCFAMLAVALIAVLVLNISVSTAQYQLVELRARQSTLTKQNQDLTQQVQNFEAPQNLAAKAKDLGMVASTVKGQIAPGVTVTEGGEPLESRKPVEDKRETPAAAPADAAASQAAQAAAAAAVPAAELHGGTVPAPKQKVPGQ